MVFDLDQFKKEVRRPQLTPDVIDDFVTWLTEHGVDLYSFQLSDTKYKRQLFNRFWKQTTADQQQYRIQFPK